MKNIPHSILTYDRMDESQKTPILKQMVKNIQLTNDYIFDLEKKLSSEPNPKTEKNLESLRTLLKNQEKEFFNAIMKIKKSNKMKEKEEPVKKSPKERFKEVSESLGEKSLSNTELLEMVRIWTEYKKQEAFLQVPVSEPEKPKKQKSNLRIWFDAFIYTMSYHLVQLLSFYFIVAACLWEFNPGNWNPALRYSVVIVSYLLTNFLLAFGEQVIGKLNKHNEGLAKRLL
jgi:hypothetical protein